MVSFLSGLQVFRGRKNGDIVIIELIVGGIAWNPTGTGGHFGGRLGFAQVLKVDETGGQARFEGDATDGRKMIYRVPTEQGEVLVGEKSPAVGGQVNRPSSFT